MCYIYEKCTEDEATLRSGTKSNEKVTHGMPHKCLTTCQQMIAIRVVLLENSQLQESSTVNFKNLKPSTPNNLKPLTPNNIELSPY